MREWAFFIASLAGAAVFTALAVLVRPDSPLWKWLLSGGIAVFAAAALVILADIVRPDGNRVWLLGLGSQRRPPLFVALPTSLIPRRPHR